MEHGLPDDPAIGPWVTAPSATQARSSRNFNIRKNLLDDDVMSEQRKAV